MMLVQFLIIAFAVLVIFRTILNFKKKRVVPKTFIFWMGLWVIVIIATVLPQSTSILSKILGVGRGVDVAVYFSILLIFFLLYKIMVRLEKIEHEITQIVRHLALKDSEKK